MKLSERTDRNIVLFMRGFAVVMLVAGLFPDWSTARHILVMVSTMVIITTTEALH